MTTSSTPPTSFSAKVPATRHDGGIATPVDDKLVREVALEILVNDEPLTMTMCTPGEELELARGILHGEGVIPETTAIAAHQLVREEQGVVARLHLTINDEFRRDAFARRALISTSSCGLCGRRDAAELDGTGQGPCALTLPPPQKRLPISEIPAMLAAMAAGQGLFAATGGCHAAAAFAPDGTPLVVCEDIGRHNAVDKVVGHLLLGPGLAAAQVLVVSGRVSYEIVQKAACARFPWVLAVSAPSTLAVRVAEKLGICLIAFCRSGRATVYTHPAYVK